MPQFGYSLYSFPSSANPQQVLPANPDRVAIVILNATNTALDVEPVEVLTVGGILASLPAGEHRIFKYRDYAQLLEREWWIGHSGVGTINVAEVYLI